MNKPVKRVHNTKIGNGPPSKLPKLLDLANLTKDISVLQTFYDFIDDSDCDAINDYLTKNDLNDFLTYFSSYKIYKPDEFCLVFKVCTEILMRIAGDLNDKHSLAGQAFAEAFLNQFKSLLYLYLKNNKSTTRIISCLKFITALILQSKDIAIKVAAELDFTKPDFVKLLEIRKLKDDEDVHTSVLNCYASFFIMGSNYLIRKVCDETGFVRKILTDLRFERFQNVQLMIEILHDKIIKNSTLSKTLKVKFFNVASLRFLLAVYQWKGAANTYHAYTELSSVDDNSGIVHNQLHSLLIDLCSSHQIGIAFIDNLLCQSQMGNLNKKLFYFIISDGMEDFPSHTLKHELLIAVLTACPDLVSLFVNHLVGKKPEHWTDTLKCIVECYEVLSGSNINNILTEALNYNKAEKFIDVALVLCLPEKSLKDLLESDENIRVNCAEELRSLRNVFINNCEKVITWINVSDRFYSPNQKLQLKSNLEEALLENYSKCGWEFELKILLSEELNDGTIFAARNEMEIDNEEASEDESIDQEIADSADKLRQLNSDPAISETNGNELLKNCYQHFISTPFVNVSLLKLIGETLKIGKFTLKKKHKRLLIEFLCGKEFLSEHWVLLMEQDDLYARSEVKRNCILDVIISCIGESKGLKSNFYQCVHPVKLFSFYGASLSHSDQKLLYLIMLQTFSGTECTDYNFLLFGNAVTEHYSIDASKSPVLRRPIVNAQCFNLLEDDKFLSTIHQFPISRTCPITNELNLVLVPPQPSIYDPYFVLEWISQLLNIDSEKGLELEFGLDMKTLFSKNIISFLVSCQTSELRHVRLVSRLILRYLLAILEATDNKSEAFPMKYQVQMILYHFFHSLSDSDDYIKVSSIFTNFYVKMLKLIDSPGKILFKPLINMFINTPKFNLKYVPNFKQLMNSKDTDARLKQAWCLGLISENIKCVDDFRVVLNSQVLDHLFSIYLVSEQNIKRIILNFIKSCVSIERVASMLYNYPQFIVWINIVAKNIKEKINRQMIINIIELFVRSLRGLENDKINVMQLENNFRLCVPEIDFESLLNTN